MLSQDFSESGSEFTLAKDEAEIDPAFVVADSNFDQSQRRLNEWKRVGFFLVNIWLVFHLFAIVVCPASVDPSSPVLQSGFDLVAPYLHLIYLDHGFHFFAPQPDPSTLISYTLEFADGSEVTGRIPDRSTFPRLLYHRHFMLTEFLGNGSDDLQPLIERAFARNLCRQTGAIRVTLKKVEHEIPSIEDIHRGLNLLDPSFYTETTLGTYTPEELNQPIFLEPKNPRSAESDRDSDISEEKP